MLGLGLVLACLLASAIGSGGGIRYVLWIFLWQPFHFADFLLVHKSVFYICGRMAEHGLFCCSFTHKQIDCECSKSDLLFLSEFKRSISLKSHQNTLRCIRPLGHCKSANFSGIDSLYCHFFRNFRFICPFIGIQMF